MIVIFVVCMNFIIFGQYTLTMHMMLAPYKEKEPQPFWNQLGIKSILSS